MKTLLSNQQLRQSSFLIIIIVLGYLIVNELLFLIPSFLGSITLYVLTHNFQKRLYRLGLKKWLIVLITMLLTLILLVIPVIIFVELLLSKIENPANYINKINYSISYVQDYLKSNFNFDLLKSDLLKNISIFLSTNFTKFINSGLSVLSSLFFAYFIFYFMLTNSDWFENRFFNYLPLKNVNAKRIKERFFKMIISNALGIPIVAIVQGITGLIGYFIVGVYDIWFWFLITIFTSAIPLVGSALAYVPIALTFFASGQNLQGIFILIWGIVIIGSIDNICRFTVLKKLDDIHPLITVFGIIFGLNIFGFLGFIFGPILISMLFILIEIYREEYI